MRRRLALLAALAPGRALAHASERMIILTLPTGRYIGPNSRAWTVEEVQSWIDALPNEKPNTKARPTHAAA